MLVRNVHVYAQFLQNSKLEHIHVLRLSNPQPPKFQSTCIFLKMLPVLIHILLWFNKYSQAKYMTSGACVLGFTFCEMFPQYQLEGKLIVDNDPINY